MKNAELYKKSCDVLFQAYFNGTLEHNNCKYCAVGNLCKEAAEKLNIDNSAWADKFFTSSGIQHIMEKKDNLIFDIKTALKLINATGYTWQELAKIEYAFETAPKGNNDEDWMFSGLCAVLEVLKEIHEVEDDSVEQQRFKKHYEMLTA